MSARERRPYHSSLCLGHHHFCPLRKLERTERLDCLFRIRRHGTDDGDARIAGQGGLEQASELGITVRDVGGRRRRVGQLADDGPESQETVTR